MCYNLAGRIETTGVVMLIILALPRLFLFGEIMETDNLLVAFGGEVKALGEGKLGGYLIRFGSPENKDLAGDYFAPDTDFGVSSEMPLLYHHGMDDTIGKRPLGKAVVVKRDDVGLWVEAQLAMRDEYEKAIYELAQKGKLGWSSGTAGYLVERADDGKILRWHLGVDASLTPTPAEPRNTVVPLKSLLPTSERASEDSADAETEEQIESENPEEGENEMEDETKTTEEAPQVGMEADALKSMIAEQMQAQLEAFAAKIAPKTKPALDGDEEKTAVKAFNVYLRGGQMSKEIKALTEGATGTAVVPVEYGDEIITALQDGSLFRKAGARVINQTVLTAKWPALSYSATASIVAEGGSYSDATPTTSEITATLYKYGKLAKVTEELLADSRFNVWGNLLSPDFANAFANAENAAFTTGTGSSQPQGVMNATVGVTAASTSAVTADELIDLFYSVNYKYRENGVWMMADSTAATIRKLKDSNNQYIWQPGLRDGQPDLLLGRPVITNNNVAAIAAGAKTIVFGDFSYYWIFQHPQQYLVRLNELYAENGYVGYKMFRRFDGHIMLADAFRVLQMAAS